MSDDPRTPPEFSVAQEWDASLVGYEPQTEPLDPRDPSDSREILRLLEDARGTDYRLVRDGANRLSLWRKASRFWE